jgi:hypothetical protein
MSIDTWLRSRPDRCSDCGHHPPTQGHGADCAPLDSREAEWLLFVTALQQVVGHDGLVHQHDVRPLIRGRVHPKHIGQLYARAKRERLLVQVDKEPSTDAAGRNTHHDSPIYQLR